jgi:hypothetical protein
MVTFWEDDIWAFLHSYSLRLVDAVRNIEVNSVVLSNMVLKLVNRDSFKIFSLIV